MGVATSAIPNLPGIPPSVPGRVFPGEGNTTTSGGAGSDLPIPRRLGSGLVLPLLSRPPAPPSLWKVLLTVEELPPRRLKDFYSTIPPARQIDAWHPRARRFPRQVTLPTGVECDLPALIGRTDGPEVSVLADFIIRAYDDMDFDDTTPVPLQEWCQIPPPSFRGMMPTPIMEWFGRSNDFVPPLTSSSTGGGWSSPTSRKRNGNTTVRNSLGGESI